MERKSYIIASRQTEWLFERFNTRKIAEYHLQSEYEQSDNFTIIEQVANVKDMITEQELITLLKLVHQATPHISENYGYSENMVKTIEHLYQDWFEEGYEPTWLNDEDEF